jgi:hypothetical protein
VVSAVLTCDRHDGRMSARLLALSLVLLLSGCSDRVERPRTATPVTKPFGTVADSPALRQCIGRLDRSVSRYALLPDRTFEGGCSAVGAVQLRDIGIPVTNLGSMTCGLAEAFTDWVQRDLQASAKAILGTRIARVETMGTYSCRTIIGAGSGKLSEHGRANAVDIGAFVLADGRRITVKDDWSNGENGEFLRAVRVAACRRFKTVLSPDYNAAHHDHLHFDMGRGPFCR